MGRKRCVVLSALVLVLPILDGCYEPVETATDQLRIQAPNDLPFTQAEFVHATKIVREAAEVAGVAENAITVLWDPDGDGRQLAEYRWIRRQDRSVSVHGCPAAIRVAVRTAGSPSTVPWDPMLEGLSLELTGQLGSSRQECYSKCRLEARKSEDSADPCNCTPSWARSDES